MRNPIEYVESLAAASAVPDLQPVEVSRKPEPIQELPRSHAITTWLASAAALGLYIGYGVSVQSEPNTPTRLVTKPSATPSTGVDWLPAEMKAPVQLHIRTFEP